MNSTIYETLSAAFAEHRPTLVSVYVRQTEYVFERCVAALGPDLKNVHNSWEWAKTYNKMLHPVTKREGADIRGRGGRYVIVPQILNAHADSYADDVIQAWSGKIQAKMGELETATVARMDGARFLIVGSRGGHKIEIQQDMTISHKGHTVFNQFPARIYIDGKFHSEAAYKKLFA